MVLVLAKQILEMFLLAGVGYLLFKAGKISGEGSRTLGNILIYVSLPAVIINGFLVERTPEHVSGILLSMAGAMALILVSVLISHFIFKNNPIGAFAAAFSNPGFFGIPLVIASLGREYVFYAACFIAFLNIGQWTYGVSRLTGQPLRQGFALKKLIRAPFVIAITVGLVLFATQLPLPGILRDGLSAAAGLNTPLAMFTVGIYLAQTDLKKMLKDRSLYAVSAVRLLLIPLAALGILSLFPASLNGMKTVLLIAAACPVGSNVAVYAQLHGKDYPYAVETVVISTALSLATIPLTVWASSMIWG